MIGRMIRGGSEVGAPAVSKRSPGSAGDDGRACATSLARKAFFALMVATTRLPRVFTVMTRSFLSLVDQFAFAAMIWRVGFGRGLLRNVLIDAALLRFGFLPWSFFFHAGVALGTPTSSAQQGSLTSPDRL
jgi:hypothetical protein